MGYCKGYHIQFEPCCINIRVKSIKAPLIVNNHYTLTMNMEIKLMWFFDLVEVKIFLLHISMSQEVIKVMKPFFRVFEIFWCTMGSKHVCLHARYRFQGFAFVENLVSTMKCNLASLWTWCQSYHSSFDGLLWLIKPYCQCIYMFNSWYLKWRSKRKFIGVGASIEESSHALVIGQFCFFKKIFIFPFACVDPLTWWPISKSRPNCQTNFWNLELTN